MTWFRPSPIILTMFLVAAAPAHADELADSYATLMQDTGNVALNLRYARLAEDHGKLKWALPAYERVLSGDPGNEAARAGMARVRAALSSTDGSAASGK